MNYLNIRTSDKSKNYPPAPKATADVSIFISKDLKFFEPSIFYVLHFKNKVKVDQSWLKYFWPKFDKYSL